MSVMSVGWGRNARVSHCIALLGFFSCNSLAKATVGEPEKDKIVLSLGASKHSNFCRLLSVRFCPFWSHFNQFSFVKL